jgi:hypothetical protein
MGETHKMTLKEIRVETESLGFGTQEILQILPMQHLLIVTRRSP